MRKEKSEGDYPRTPEYFNKKRNSDIYGGFVPKDIQATLPQYQHLITHKEEKRDDNFRIASGDYLVK